MKRTIDNTIGYLGPKGTFSQQAALAYEKEGVLQPFSTFADILEAVDKGEISKGIVPIENSIEGAVNTILDMMLFDVNVKIQKEIVLPVEQHLMVRSEVKLEEITQVLSHTQAIGQCRNFLHHILHDSAIQFTSSTAEAAQMVANSSAHWGAIGNILAAEIYGLKIIQHNIQDNQINETRFVVVGKDDCPLGEDSSRKEWKTSIAFSTDKTNKPGELYKILNIFALWDINMTKIVSRPAKNKLGQYIFFIDLEGHREQPDMKDALQMIQRKTSFFKLMGSYER